MGLELTELFRIASEDDLKKLKIIAGFTENIEDISVTTICENAGISRQFFYRHFDSKYGASNWFATFLHRFYLAEIGKKYTWEEAYCLHAELYLNNWNIIQYTAPKDHHRESPTNFNAAGIMDDWASFRYDYLYHQLQEAGLEMNDKLLFCLRNHVRTESYSFKEWSREGMVLSPQAFGEALACCVPSPLLKALSPQKK